MLAWVVLSLWLWVEARRPRSPARSLATRRSRGGRGGAGAAWQPNRARDAGRAREDAKRRWQPNGCCGPPRRLWPGLRQQANCLVLASLLCVAACRGDARELWRRPGAWFRRAWFRGWPALAVAVLVVVPYLVWDPRSMFDDVWRWSNGPPQRHIRSGAGEPPTWFWRPVGSKAGSTIGRSGRRS